MNDPLTTAEKIFIEHWARRKWQVLRIYLLFGALAWGGLMSFFMLYPKYAAGEISVAMAAISSSIFIFGGLIFGLFMWSVTEFRYRRMAAKGRNSGT